MIIIKTIKQTHTHWCYFMLNIAVLKFLIWFLFMLLVPDGLYINLCVIVCCVYSVCMWVLHFQNSQQNLYLLSSNIQRYLWLQPPPSTSLLWLSVQPPVISIKFAHKILSPFFFYWGQELISCTVKTACQVYTLLSALSHPQQWTVDRFGAQNFHEGPGFLLDSYVSNITNLK